MSPRSSRASFTGPGDTESPFDRAADLRARREHIRAVNQARTHARRRAAVLFGILGIVTVAALVLNLVKSNGSGTPPLHGKAAAAAARLTLPRLHMALTGAGSTGALPGMPFPQKGQGAVALLGSGVVASSKNEHPVPIASVTKVMTAYLVLKAHPLTGNAQGPSLHFTAADHQRWINASANNLSNVELVKGESLTERQLLEALLIPSADNVADILAKWTAGSEAAFVAKMNATAKAFGMDHTHYADASGVDPHSVSTAADQALLASIVMRNRVFSSIVALPDVAFPVMGHIWNYNPVLGTEGIVGVKSGFTQAALGCLVTAAWRTVGDRRVLVIAASTGQPLGLGEAGTTDQALLKAASARLQLVSPFGSQTGVANVTIPWSHHAVTASIAEPVRLAGWSGLRYSASLIGARVTEANLQHGWAAGAKVGELVVRSQFGPVAVMPVDLVTAIAPPPAGSIHFRPPVSLAVGR